MQATVSPCGLQPFEAQSDHWGPSEHATQVQRLHAFSHIERHAGQNVLSERERGASGGGATWLSPSPSHTGPGRTPDVPRVPPQPPPRRAPAHTQAVRGCQGWALAGIPRESVTT